VNFDLGEVLSRAWQITWKNKILWVFNILPALLSLLFIPIVFIPMFFIGPNSLINQDFVDQPYYVSLFIGTNLVLTVLSVLFYAAGSSSAYLGNLRAESGRVQLPFRDLFQDELKYFWRILGVSLLVGAVASAVFLLMFGCMMLVGMVTMGLGMICLQPLFLLLYPAMLIAYALIEQSQAGVVTDNLGVIEALSRGWALIRAHFWRFFLISLVIYFGLFILSSIGMLPFMVPFIFLPLIMGGDPSSIDPQGIGWVLLLISILFLPVLALIQGLSLTFMKSAFMIVYLRLTRPIGLLTVPQSLS
jgi:hypothetical protein